MGQQGFDQIRTAGSACHKVVADERQEKPGDDGDLLDRGKCSAITGWRHFTDVGRREHTRRADGQSAQHTVEDELDGAARSARSPGADNKTQGRDAHDRASPEAIGHAPREKSADRTAEQHRRDVESCAYFVGVERGLQAIHGAVNDAGVEAEEEAADGCDAADYNDVKRVLRVVARLQWSFPG